MAQPCIGSFWSVRRIRRSSVPWRISGTAGRLMVSNVDTTAGDAGCQQGRPDWVITVRRARRRFHARLSSGTVTVSIARRLAILAGLGGVCLLAARPAAQEPQPPTTPGQVFRTGVDVIRVDVTVLDKNRKPIRGLTADDFTVRENGRPQRIVTVGEVSGEDADPTPSAWMRYAPRDVTTNDLADQLGDGRAIALVLDDFS